MSRHSDRMVFDYIVPTKEEPSGVYEFGDNVNDVFYAQSTPRDIPRTRYTTTVAPADLYTAAVAPSRMVTGQEYYSSRPMTGYLSPPDSYQNRFVQDRAAASRRQSNYDERPPQPDYEVKTVASSTSKRYFCDVPDCVDENGRRKSVGRKADLKRHMDSVHGKPTIDCSYPKCWRRGDDGFRREDHYKEHLRGYHNAQIPKADRSRRAS